MICNDCQGIVVLHALSHSNCNICGEEVVTPHTPSYKICSKCADTKSLCEQCGKSLNDYDKGQEES